MIKPTSSLFENDLWYIIPWDLHIHHQVYHICLWVITIEFHFPLLLHWDCWPPKWRPLWANLHGFVCGTNRFSFVLFQIRVHPKWKHHPEKWFAHSHMIYIIYSSWLFFFFVARCYGPFTPFPPRMSKSSTGNRKPPSASDEREPMWRRVEQMALWSTPRWAGWDWISMRQFWVKRKLKERVCLYKKDATKTGWSSCLGRKAEMV